MKTKLSIILLTLSALFTHFSSYAQDTLELKRDSIAHSIGVKIEKSLGSGEVDYLLSVIDEEKLLGKFLIKRDSNEALTQLNEVLVQNVLKGVFKVVAEEIEAGSYYDFISYYSDEENENYFLNFRLYGIEGLNYHEYQLKFDDDNNASILDIHILAAGELLSETLAKIYLPNAQKTLAKNQISTQNIIEIESYQKLGKIFKLVRDNNRLGAWIIFCTIPPEIRNRKNFIIAELSILDFENSEKETIDAISRFNALYPNDSSWYLYALTMYSLQENYDQALLMADSLLYQTNDDFINYQIGDLYFLKTDYEEARKYYSYIVTNYPNFEDGVTSLLLSCTRLEDYERAVETLEYLIKLGFTKEEIIAYIEEEVEYKKFSKSKSFSKWKKKEYRL